MGTEPKSSKVARKSSVELIPRHVLFGNPEVKGASLSPDGRFLAFLKPWKGVLNIFTLSVEDSLKQDGLLGGKQLTFEKKRSPMFKWTHQPGVLLYAMDNDGDENWRIVKASVGDGRLEPITEGGKSRASVYALSAKRPDTVVIELNDEDPRWANLYYVNLVDGSRSLCFNNSAQMRAMYVDSELRVRLAVRAADDASDAYFKVQQNGELSIYYSVPFEEVAFHGVYGIVEADNSKVAWKSGQGREFPDLVVKPLEDPFSKGELIHRPKRAEITEKWAWPASKNRPIFVVEDPGRPVKTLLDFEFKEAFEFLTAKTAEQGADWHHIGYSEDLRTWLVRFPALTSHNCFLNWTKFEIAMDYADAGMAAYVFFPEELSLRLLYTSRPELAHYRLAKMYNYTVDTQDGLKMACYLSIPRTEDVMGTGVPLAPLPMVLKVHGGPWARSSFGFDGVTQWLVNRGYAVLDCNFRGSTGFGRRHFQASFGEWAGAMQQDLLDAVEWAVRLGVAARERVAIYGWSYGGYAALVGATFNPDVFACAVDVVGPSNLTNLIMSTPPQWTSLYKTLLRYVGADPGTAEGRAFLAARSPITFVDRITKPLLVVQGANDPRVPIRESQQIVDAMKAKNIPATYVVFPDEGHSVRRPENKEALWYVVETFLQGCLGGRAEAAAPGLLDKSSAQIRQTGGLDLPQWTFDPDHRRR